MRRAECCICACILDAMDQPIVGVGERLLWVRRRTTTESIFSRGAERAIRMVRQHGSEHPSQWAAIASIASKLGCTAETLRRWVRQAERDTGDRSGLTTDERQRLKELEREVRELRRANEILRKASAYFAQAELDRRPK